MGFVKCAILTISLIFMLFGFIKAFSIQSDEGNAEQDCPPGKAMKDGVCTATCEDSRDCRNGRSCTKNGDNFFCHCNRGTEGDFCDIITDCETTGKYRECRGDKGTCIYSFVNERAECVCNGDKKLNEAKGFCAATCMENGHDCKNGGSCTKNGDYFFCQCKKGTEGDFCDIVTDCQTTGKYKECSGKNGTCRYSVENERAECACYGNKKFNDTKGFCVDECTERGKECKNGGLCVVEGFNVSCWCPRGTKGNNCDIVSACQVTGKYAKCKGENGTCYYSFREREAKCSCPHNKTLNEKKGYCEEESTTVMSSTATHTEQPASTPESTSLFTTTIEPKSTIPTREPSSTTAMNSKNQIFISNSIIINNLNLNFN